MADLGKIMNPNNYEELGSYAPVPTGDYTITIESTERKGLNSGKGDKLVIRYRIIKGEHEGCRVFDNLSLWHTESQDAVQFSERKLAQICRTVGIEQISDSNDLIGKSLILQVIQKENDGTKYNDISGYHSIIANTSDKQAGDGPKQTVMPWNK